MKIKHIVFKCVKGQVKMWILTSFLPLTYFIYVKFAIKCVFVQVTHFLYTFLHDVFKTVQSFF